MNLSGPVFLNCFEIEVCEPFNELVIKSWWEGGWFFPLEGKGLRFLFGKNSSLLSTVKGCHHMAAQYNLHILCSYCRAVSEHWICWCRFILTGNNANTQVCCQNRIFTGGILLNQMNKNA